jgi:hypothetical protein
MDVKPLSHREFQALKLKTISGGGFKISFVLNGVGIGVENVMTVVDMRKDLSK